MDSHESNAMTTIAVFGGSGATGQVFIPKMLNDGFNVRALARRPDALWNPVGLTVLQGELLDAAAVAATVVGRQAAVCLFGPRPPYTDIFCAEATCNIVAAM